MVIHLQFVDVIVSTADQSTTEVRAYERQSKYATTYVTALHRLWGNIIVTDTDLAFCLVTRRVRPQWHHADVIRLQSLFISCPGERRFQLVAVRQKYPKIDRGLSIA